MVRRPRAGDFERDGESGLLLPRRTIERAHPQYLGPPFFSGGSDDQYASSVVLLMHGDGANGGTTYTDSSSYARTVTNYGAGTVTTSTAQAKYGTSSLLFPGDARLAPPDSSDFQLGSSPLSPMTLEFWLYFNSVGGTQVVLDNRAGATTSTWSNVLDSGKLNFYDGSSLLPTTTTIAIGTWIHYAVNKAAGDGGRWDLYVNGVSENNFVLNNGGETNCNIGGREDNAFYLSAHMHMRWTIGAERYPGGTSFTPPASFM